MLFIYKGITKVYLGAKNAIIRIPCKLLKKGDYKLIQLDSNDKGFMLSPFVRFERKKGKIAIYRNSHICYIKLDKDLLEYTRLKVNIELKIYLDKYRNSDILFIFPPTGVRR